MATRKTAKADEPKDEGANGAPEPADRPAPKRADVQRQIVIPALQIQFCEVRLVGDSGLVTHNWSRKSKELMLAKQMQEASPGKEPKDPQRDFEESMYHLDGGGYGFPAIAFKNAAVSACTSLGKSISKVAARQAFHIVGELIRIEGTPRMREDMVRVGQGTADIRFRAEFPEWAVTLTIRYNARVLSAAQIVNMLNTAGFAVGVGEWRSEKDGSFGLFHVESSK
jgi:hypothetical protein